MQSKG